MNKTDSRKESNGKLHRINCGMAKSPGYIQAKSNNLGNVLITFQLKMTICILSLWGAKVHFFTV